MHETKMYHVNNNTGIPGLCKNNLDKCPYASRENHYTSYGEAQAVGLELLAVYHKLSLKHKGDDAELAENMITEKYSELGLDKYDYLDNIDDHAIRQILITTDDTVLMMYVLKGFVCRDETGWDKLGQVLLNPNLPRIFIESVCHNPGEYNEITLNWLTRNPALTYSDLAKITKRCESVEIQMLALNHPALDVNYYHKCLRKYPEALVEKPWIAMVNNKAFKDDRSHKIYMEMAKEHGWKTQDDGLDKLLSEYPKTKKMYHMNYDMKIHPCKAQIMKCPYGSNMHAETKNELYHKFIRGIYGKQSSEKGLREMDRIGRLKSFYCLSDDLDHIAYPVETIVSTLQFAIDEIKENMPKDPPLIYKSIFKDGVRRCYVALLYGMGMPDIVPKDIKYEAIRLFEEKRGGIPLEHYPASQNPKGAKIKEDVDDMEYEFELYDQYIEYELNRENLKNSLDWMTETFYQFAHDLNTSKIVTQPMFYGNIKTAQKTIGSMGDYELISTYDDYLLTVKEVRKNVNMANDFNYSYRNDLKDRANSSLNRWYTRNREMCECWQFDKRKRILITIALADELDKRDLCRQNYINIKEM